MLPHFRVVHNENLSHDSCPQSAQHLPALTAGSRPAVVAAHSWEGGGFTPLYSPARAGSSPEEGTQMRAADSELENSPFSSLCGPILIEPCFVLGTRTRNYQEPGPGLQELVSEAGGGPVHRASQHPHGPSCPGQSPFLCLLIGLPHSTGTSVRPGPCLPCDWYSGSQPVPGTWHTYSKTDLEGGRRAGYRC